MSYISRHWHLFIINKNKKNTKQNYIIILIILYFLLFQNANI